MLNTPVEYLVCSTFMLTYLAILSSHVSMLANCRRSAGLGRT